MKECPHPPRKAVAATADDDGMEDMDVTCKDYRSPFVFTVREQKFFKENGYWTASVGKVFHNADNEHGDIAWNEHVRFVNVKSNQTFK